MKVTGGEGTMLPFARVGGKGQPGLGGGLMGPWPCKEGTGLRVTPGDMYPREAGLGTGH